MSFDDQAQETIQQSLQQSERFLFEGRDRQAVQEVLWLLETVSIAFQGLDTGAAGTVQGKYFNKIVDDLRKQYKGKSLEQILDWVRTLHGYLSSPTGGGVRHRRRFADHTLGEVGDWPLDQTLKFFHDLRLSKDQQQVAGELLREIRNRLKFLVEVGLDYLSLSRATPTLSGGESQRIRLASQIGSG